jgi:hypothetical protein
VSGECTCGPGWWGNRCHLKCDAFRCLKEKFRLHFSYNFVFYFVVSEKANIIGRKEETVEVFMDIFLKILLQTWTRLD